jgi:thiamine kinase-like enzyme
MDLDRLGMLLTDLLPDWAGKQIVWSKASAGYTHETYFAKADGQSVVLKLLNEEMLEGFLRSDAATVFASTRFAASAGVGAPVLGVGEDPARIVLGFLEGRGLERDEVTAPDMLERVVQAVRRLHSQPPPQHRAGAVDRGRFWIAGLGEFGSQWAQPYTRLGPVLDEIDTALSSRAAPSCFTHNDLFWENIIDGGDQIYILDYDLAGAGDPAYDLGDLAAQHELTPAAQGLLCRSYYGREDERDLSVLRLGRIAADIIQGAVIAYALARYPERFADDAEALSSWTGQKAEKAKADSEAPLFAADLKLSGEQVLASFWPQPR